MSADQDDSAEKSFEASAHKLQEARKKGDFPRSVDLHTAAAYAGFLLFLSQFAGPQLGEVARIGSRLLEDSDGLSQRFLYSSEYRTVGEFMLLIGLSVMLVFLIPSLAVVASLAAQRAVVFAPNKIEPKLSKISPLSNAKQKFGPDGLMEFFKSFVKMVVFGTTLVVFLLYHVETLIGLAMLSPEMILLELGRLLLGFMALIVAISLSIGAIDYLWQNFEHHRKQRMTRKELVDENRQSEGDPHLKGKRRQKAQEVALNQMLSDVPDATVIIVNPTHYAVALKWAPGDSTPPICVAKGIDEVAARIREIAAENGVPIRLDPPTARAIYANVEIGHPIDRAQFAAVAAAIRFAEDMRKKSKGIMWKTSQN